MRAVHKETEHLK